MTTNSENSVTNSLQEQYIIDANGNKTAVILAIEQYEQLLEDLHDLAIVAERHQEQPISLEEMQKRLDEHGAV
ncbi:prevent-host-death family protein [filamentous cyanobacterium CCP1]|nr:prevent-host-death family protein [filamentous cyanobacterium CCP2]PSB66489.1 prevent-host-death family protein [filamentous cyanobacterium CCP1]